MVRDRTRSARCVAFSTSDAGFYVSLTAACVYLMLFSSPRKPSWPIIAYIVLLSIGATLFTGTNWRWSQNLFVDSRGYELVLNA